ncbi:ATP phosphoribosyltransferase [Sphaerochaeta pleomorpha str. Grapes]|uniref:ATP phosphoribosyltransferase n=1 Tax=Sphaerochaeta pleomorpha (strain ATCC BAA-1885 / DSM 22778 / Grapes) TaxID=158190 RepID=G8QTU1_SPHPG|nr:ATP phosphoribosyltransferase [Sphaerochaeta pleomorpha]AEV29117.1 ATP phosphoribosyltransferase [Sphaerochaeta pleomorpha str. Grapes]
MEKMLRIAVQKSGRLSEKSLEIIKNCGIKFGSDSRVLKEQASNFPIEFLYVRDDDIPTYVRDGVADIGIVGRNEYDEQAIDLAIIRDLGFAKCRLSIAVPNDFTYTGLSCLQGKRIATSYPHILAGVLKENKVTASFVQVSGSVEVTPAVGISDAICDLVSTGATLAMNGLREVETIYTSTAVMIGRNEMGDDQKSSILKRLMLRIDAVMRANNYKYVIFNLPEEHLDQVARIVGGMKSPTVTRLMEKGWVSVQTVVAEDTFWDVFEQLKDLGAQGILVTPIEKMTE